MDEEQIASLRDKIDGIDAEMVLLLNKRAELALEVRGLKNRKQLPIYDAKREEEILQKVVDSNSGPLSAEHLREIYQVILKCMKAFE